MKKTMPDIQAIYHLRQSGRLQEAVQLLQDFLKVHSDSAAAYNNLGAVYYAQEKLSEAVSCYYRTIELQPDYREAYYNLGLALTKLDQLDEAVKIYQQLVAMSPQHEAALFQLGCLFMRLTRFDEAIHYFLLVAELNPQHLEAETNLATCYLKGGALSQAKNHYLQALSVAPDDIQILFNLGVINMQQGHTDSAIQHYQQAIKIHPDFFEAHNNLGVAFLAKQHIGNALLHFREASRIRPDNEAIRYTVHMLSQDQRLLAAPAEYIKTLFDAYADHYEPHLLETLDYQVPMLLLQMVQKVRKEVEWDILDLGCGTGLSGLAFKDRAKRLIGVDLSSKMLEVAAEKKIYDELIASDMVSFLASKRSDYDLILAADVLVYRGDLRQLFISISQALRSRGLFVFNTEINSRGDFYMMQSGRFAHNKIYLDGLIAASGLQVVAYQVAITRMQNHEPVYGHIYVVEK